MARESGTEVALRGDSVIARLEAAKVALADADIKTAKSIADVAAACEVYAARQKLGEEVEQQAYAIKIDALRRLGELLKATPKNTGQRLRGRDSFGGTKQEPPKDTPTLSELGVDKKTSAMAQKLAALSEKDFAAVRDGYEVVGKALKKASSTRDKAKTEPPKPDKRDAEIIRLKEALEKANEKREAAAEEAERLQDKLTVYEATDPDDQQKLIAQLQKEVKKRDAEIQRLQRERSFLTDKCNQMMRQIKMQRKAA